MITKRLAILLLVVAGGLSAIFLLPKSYDQPFGIVLQLPDYVGEWKGTSQDVTEKEHQVLGKGTEFARSVYQNPYSPLKNYRLVASVILSGHDMSTSIHRPERCLQAQGWNLTGNQVSKVEVSGGGTFPMTVLYTTRIQRDSAGKDRLAKSINCYWFAGFNELTASHWSRTYIDNRDRLFKGVNQRWAYVLITAPIPDSDADHADLARKWTEDTVRKFVAQLEPRLHGATLRY